ncbi:FprA family A-type flavoprotein [Alloprevotella sp. OH1205_COT-284]|uniref:FprA family A-type flavoprotein n=1 Tax=Alloprevotella sp. OH1205_COT-284 TaxID=2491043 RepID=UPI000F5E4120|nr:MBL fold metallo-hydrolase [Alloprevotella sp. OH1205_COT-284]RRD80085.1 FprA family A-type flavoprotein [Alloprevotella sp. OH1205_COT-284]
MEPVISPTIKYIGVDDRDLDLFESQYRVPEGMCYNSYLILDEKVCIMDTVDPRCVDEWNNKLHAALDGRTPDYLVVQHVEPDHAGAIADVVNAYPDLKVVASAKAIAFIAQFNEGIDLSDRSIAVTDGSTLELGTRTLTFATAPMVHWPEVIVTYDDKDKALFSADAFGRFGFYELDDDKWLEESRRYYINICGRYGMQVGKLLEKVAKFDVEMICSLHGNVLRGEKKAEAIRLYHIWAKYEVETPGVLVAYASIHGSTKAAALRLAEILKEKGAPAVEVADLARGLMDKAVSDAFRYGSLVLCASSYDSEVFPPMHYFIHKLRLKGYQNRRVAIVENGTWAPTAGKTMRAELEAFKKLDIVEPVFTIKSTLKSTDVTALETLAEAVLA